MSKIPFTNNNFTFAKDEKQLIRIIFQKEDTNCLEHVKI